MSGQMELHEMVRRASARERALARLATLLSAGAVLAAVIALALAVLGGGRWVSLHPLLPVGFLLLAALSAVGVLAVGELRARRGSELGRLARAIEQERRLRRGSVAGLLELAGRGGVTARASERVAASLAGENLLPVRERRSRRRLALGAAALLLATAGFTWSSATHQDAFDVLASPLQAARGELLPPLSMVAPAAVPRGREAHVTIVAAARKTVKLHTRVVGEEWKATVIEVSDGRAETRIGSVNAVTTIFASDGRGSSDTIVIRPSDRAFVSELVLVASYPAHLERPSEPISATGTVTLPAGTSVRVRGQATVPLAAVELRAAGHTTSLATAGPAFSGAFTVSRPLVFEWNVTAADGQPMDQPDPLRFEVIVDQLPEIEIVSPAADTSVTGESPIRVVVRAADDHGLGAVTLQVRRSGGERNGSRDNPALGDSERNVPLEIPRAGGLATMMLDLRALRPGERVVLEASAHEDVADGRRASSAPRTVTILGGSDQRAAARAAALAANDLADELLASQRSVERRTGEIARSRGDRRSAAERGDTPPAAGHALASRARSVVEEQRSLAARADSIASVTRALESRLDRAGALDEGLAARIAEVRSLLERALTPELAAALREAEQAARDNTEEPLRRSLLDVAREQRRAREQLERIVQMLRRAAIEGALETLRAEAGELGESVQRGASPDQAPRSAQLERDIADVLRRLREENASAGVAPADRARSRAASASGLLARGTGRGGGAQELGEAADALADARAAQIAEWKSELAADLDAAVQELLQLAAAEERLARRTAAGRPEWRAEQDALGEAATAVADRVSQAARRSSLISARSDGLVRAARDRVTRISAPTIPPRDLTQTATAMRVASDALSRAAASLVRDRDRTNSARSASGFTELLEQLRRLAEEQRGINAGAAHLPFLLGGANAAVGREQARALARQQRGVARALEELSDADGGGRAGPLAAEANRLADALERAAVDASVLARQERLYHRLLEGGRLLTGDTGEDEARREATAAADPFPVVRSGDGFVAAERRHRLPPWSELRGLTPEERQMVLEYFERINAAR